MVAFFLIYPIYWTSSLLLSLYCIYLNERRLNKIKFILTKNISNSIKISDMKQIVIMKLSEYMNYNIR